MVVWADWCVGQVLATLERLDLTGKTLVIFTSDNGPRHGQNGHRSAGTWRGFKSHIWEGGHRVPFIARWPERIGAGQISDELICLTDLTATCADIVGAKLSHDEGPDSFSILPALLAAKPARPVRSAVVLHSCYGAFAIRQGKWKLILGTKTSGGWVKPGGKKPVPGTPGQLYDLVDDPREQNDLWDAHPEVVQRLAHLLDDYKTRGHSRF
jgi:arylsulfatase A-like enzyme